MIKINLFILLFIALLFSAVSHAETDKFVAFIDKFAQEPFLLEEKERLFVFDLSSTQLRILRNTTFARHGYIFDSEDLISFYSSRKWYKPISRNIELTEIDKQNINFILKFENPKEAKFGDYLNLFKLKRLPIEIKDENYATDYSQTIPLYYVKKYFSICCPEIRALDKIYFNDKFIVLITGVHWAGVHVSLTTYSLTGDKIDGQQIAKYSGDIAGFTTSDVIIDKDLTITIKKQNVESRYDTEADKATNVLRSQSIDKFQIDSQGHIRKL